MAAELLLLTGVPSPARDDVPRISADGSPVAAIMRDQLGPATERTLLVAITIAFFGAGIVVGLLFLGGLFFAVLLRLGRRAMETEPGEVDFLAD